MLDPALHVHPLNSGTIPIQRKCIDSGIRFYENRVAIIAGLVLTASAFAQEPTRAVVAKDPVAPSGVSREQVVATGSSQRTGPIVQPKALPPLRKRR